MKVSVIVATFRSGDGLQRVIDSLDAQTMSTDDFEVIFVDDGSGDDTPARLHELASRHPNYRVIEIENSGWGSRPRNVGIEAALGEYVTFMDHDDLLYPDALRSAYEAGASIGADFVNPKEVTNRGWSWGWDVWKEDRYVTDRADITPRDVTPLIPHKLYRREFLNEHGIRFPEGPRAFWEDFFVNTEVFVHAQRIAILSSVPFYKWHRATGSNSSDKLYENVEEYWSKLSAVAEFMTEKVPDAAARRWLLINHYRWWVLDLFGPRMFQRPPGFVRDSLPYALDFLARWVPENSSDELGPALKAVAHLLEIGDLDRLEQLAHVDDGVAATAAATLVEWTADGLHVVAEATWADATGEPLLFRRGSGGTLRRELPGIDLPDSVLDVTEAIDEAWAGLNVRVRGDRVSWRLPTTTTVTLDDRGAGLVSVRVGVESTIDPGTAVFGRPLDAGTWEVGARFGFMGIEVHAGVTREGSALPAIHDGRASVAYATGRGGLAVDVGSHAKQLVTPGRLAVASARVDRGSLRIPLTRIALFGAFEGEVLVTIDGFARDARIDGDTLVVPLPAKRGVYPWTVTIDGLESKPLPPITVGRFGKASI